MTIRDFLCCLSIGLSVSTYLSAQELNSSVLQKIWSLGKQNACTAEMRQSFSSENLNRFSEEIKNSTDRVALASVLNPFLFSLGMSHTKFFSDEDEDFYFFKTHHALMDPNLTAPPQFITPGVQLGKDSGGYFVRETLDGFPAKATGILRGDRIIGVDGESFSGFWGTTPRLASVEIERNSVKSKITLELLAVNWSEAFLKATRESVSIIEKKEGNIGYVRLWTGTHPHSDALLTDLIANLKPKVKSIILDLRGGYGGAWWAHLDPFFKDSSSYFVAQTRDADGVVETMKPPIKNNEHHFDGPMVVLINEGVRSGKEALAYQFTKTKRAVLIGTKTPGYFSVGAFYFTGLPVDYALYLCAKQITLDGIEIEGRGIQPDLEIPFSIEAPFNDSQFNRAVEYLSKVSSAAR